MHAGEYLRECAVRIPCGTTCSGRICVLRCAFAPPEPASPLIVCTCADLRFLPETDVHTYMLATGGPAAPHDGYQEAGGAPCDGERA